MSQLGLIRLWSYDTHSAQRGVTSRSCGPTRGSSHTQSLTHEAPLPGLGSTAPSTDEGLYIDQDTHLSHQGSDQWSSPKSTGCEDLRAGTPACHHKDGWCCKSGPNSCAAAGGKVMPRDRALPSCQGTPPQPLREPPPQNTGQVAPWHPTQKQVGDLGPPCQHTAQPRWEESPNLWRRGGTPYRHRSF